MRKAVALGRACGAFCLLVIGLANLGWAAVVTVPAGGDIQAAIDGAAAGDIIQLQAGTYAGPVDFLGKTITVQGQVDGNGAPLSIISGGGGAFGSVVVCTNGESRATVLENVRVTGGSGLGGYPGGIVISSSSPTVRNCLITGNSSPRAGSGGGIGVWWGGPLVENCTIVGNWAENQGGGLAAYGTGGLEVRNSTIEANSSGSGGGLFFESSSSVVLANNLIRNNSAYNGNGVFFWASTGQMTNCEVTNNTADPRAYEPHGGAVLDSQSTVTYAGNLFAANSATLGGGFYLDSTQATIQNNLLVANSGRDVLTGYDSQTTGRQSAIRNNTFHLNSSDADRGIIDGRGLDMMVTNNIISHSPSGQGVARDVSSPMTIAYNCLFANANGNYSALVGDRTGYDGNLAYNPQFVDPDLGDYHLQSRGGHWDGSTWVLDPLTSPCLDSGDPASDATQEPAPNDGPVEMGRYGNTAEASRSSLFFAHSPANGSVGIQRGAPLVMSFPVPIWQPSFEARCQVQYLLEEEKAGAQESLGGTFTWLIPGLKVAFQPDQPLTAGTQCEVTVAAGVQRKNGPAYTLPYGFAFTTSGQPRVTGYSPTGGDVVTGNMRLYVTFDMPMHRKSVERNLRITPATAGVFAWMPGNTVRFTPDTPWAASSTYHVEMLTGARSATGERLLDKVAWDFQTGVASGLAVAATAATARGGMTHLTVHLSAAAEVQVRVLNLAGREVKCLPPEKLEAGTSHVLWNGCNASAAVAPAGRYLAVVTACGSSGQTARCVVPVQR